MYDLQCLTDAEGSDWVTHKNELILINTVKKYTDISGVTASYFLISPYLQ